MTCVASNCPIVTAGADIVWADIDPATGCLDVESVKTALAANPVIINDQVYAEKTATKAVIVVAWAGNPPDLVGLRAVCDHYGTKLILDAAHAFGAQYYTEQHPNVNMFSQIADFTCFSFQAIKHVTTGDGGMLVCRSESDWKLAKQLKWFGIDRDAAKDAQGNWRGQHWDFDVVDAGFKFNMNNLTAAIGLSQLPHVDKILKGHKDNAALYTDLLSKSKFLTPLKTVAGAESAHWVYTVLLNEEHKHIRDELLKQLNAEGIGAGLVHVPNDDYTCFAKFKKDLPGVRSFFSRQLSLPVGWWLKPSHIKKIARRVDQLCKELTK
jgi:dTDP-4-amino-4,6-dideoxygalactose transaminase